MPGYRAGIRPRPMILLLFALAVAARMSGDAAAQSFGHGLPSLPAAAPIQLTLSPQPRPPRPLERLGPPAAPIQGTPRLQPRPPRRLERLALASSGRRPLPPRLMRALFLPPQRDI